MGGRVHNPAEDAGSNFQLRGPTFCGCGRGKMFFWASGGYISSLNRDHLAKSVREGRTSVPSVRRGCNKPVPGRDTNISFPFHPLSAKPSPPGETLLIDIPWNKGARSGIPPSKQVCTPFHQPTRVLPLGTDFRRQIEAESSMPRFVPDPARSRLSSLLVT